MVGEVQEIGNGLKNSVEGQIDMIFLSDLKSSVYLHKLHPFRWRIKARQLYVTNMYFLPTVDGWGRVPFLLRLRHSNR